MRGVFLISGTLLGGCVAIPQSRPELVRAVKKGGFGTGAESFVVARDLESVVAMY